MSKLPDPPAGPAWWVALEQARLLEEGQRQTWERHYASQMSYGEFQLGISLQRYVNEGRMRPEDARQEMAAYKAHEAGMAASKCPECGSGDLYGPVSDYWGKCCVSCGHELVKHPDN